MKLRRTALAALLALFVTACGGSAEVTSTTTQAAEQASSAASDAADAIEEAAEDLIPTDEAVDDLLESSEEMVDSMTDSLEDAQEAVGGGTATLTVGDESWTFSPVLCAFGPEEIGQEGAEFVLSSISDGKQMYFSIDSFGHSVSIDDIEDFQNPSVSLSSFGGENDIVLDGKNFSGSADFLDGTSDSFETIPGTFSGTCP